MNVVHQIIAYLDREGLLTDEFYDRLMAMGWMPPCHFKGRRVTRTELRVLEAEGSVADVEEDGGETAGRFAEQGGVGHGAKRDSVRDRRQDDREYEHERRRVFREIGAALAGADLPASLELAGLRELAAWLDATTPWMRPLLEAPEEALDGALLAAISAGVPSAASLLAALGSEVCRFPLSDPRWAHYPGALRAYASAVGGSDAASLQRTARGYAWILREKGVVTAHEVARSQQRVLESLGRLSNVAPETVERWLAASGHGQQHDPKAGDVQVVDLGKGVTLELVWIPNGTFLMGNQKEFALFNAHPQHEVTFCRGFWMGKYPVIQAQWEAIMGNNPSWFMGDGRLPVECVSWYDCQEFLKKINEKCLGAFRLPSEAEWECACRASTQTRFYWGDDPGGTRIEDYAWYNGNRGHRTHPVGEKLPNAWGLYDMSGNVWEWCEDDWHDDYEGAPNDGSAWMDIPRGSGQVSRGGSEHWECRSAYRYGRTPEYRSSDLGFRLAGSQGARADGYERARVLPEIVSALEAVDIPRSPEFSGLRDLALRLDATTPWMKAVLNADPFTLDAALLDAMKANAPSANALWMALGCEAFRFPLTDPRWVKHKALLRAYREMVSGRDAGSIGSTSWEHAWILHEKRLAPVYETARVQQLVLESMDRVTARTPKTVERWLASSDMPPRKGAQPGDVDRVVMWLLSHSVDELELSARASHCLRAAGIVSIGQLVIMTESELMNLPNFGKKSLYEIKAILDAQKLHLDMKIPGLEKDTAEVEQD